MLELQVRPQMLTTDGRYLGEIPYGDSIGQIVDRLDVSHETRSNLVVQIDNKVVPLVMWDRVWPKDMRRIDIYHVPRGDSGKAILASVLMIALSFVTFGVGSYIGVATVLAGEAGALAVAATGMGIMLVGSLAISALFPPPGQPDTPGASEAYSFSGIANKARPGEGIMRIFGRIRVFPDVAAMPYSTVYDGDEYLTALFCYGYSEIDLSETTVGAVSWDNMKDASLVTHPHYKNESLQNYPHDVFQDDPGITLTNEENRPNTDWWGPPASDENWYILRSLSNTDNVSFTFSMPQGLSSGTDTTHLNIYIEYRLVGSTSWITAHDLTNELASTDDRIKWAYGYGMWHLHQKEEIHKPYMTSITMHMPGRGQYEFRIGRSFWGKNKAKKRRKCDIRYMQSITEEKPINTPVPITISELHVRSTDQLSGVIDDISSLCEAKIPVIASGVWTSPQATRNPAWIYLSVLKSDSNTSAISDYEIDLGSFVKWAAYCDQIVDGEKFITCNFAHTGQETVNQMLQKIAACGNASRTTRDGRQSIIWDSVHDYPTQVFTQRNSWGFALEKSFIEQPHGLIISCLDEDDDYLQSEVTVFAPGYSAANAIKFESMEAFGCTVKAQAIRFGQRYLAMSRYRSEFFSFNADIENLASERGDRIRVSYDAVKEGGKSGRIMELIGAPGQVTGLRLDQKHDAAFSHSNKHGLLVRTVVNDAPLIYVQPVDTVLDEYSLQFVHPVSEHIAVGNLVVFGEIDEISEDYLITKIIPSQDLTAQIECTPYAPEMQELRNGGTQPNTCGLTVVALPEQVLVGDTVNLSLRHYAGEVASVIWSAPGSSQHIAEIEQIAVTYAVAGVYTATAHVTYTTGESCIDSATITVG